jgi:hypothetical protein
MWDAGEKVSDQENIGLLLTLSELELELIVKDMKTNMVSGLDGFPVALKKALAAC